ncbi:hypothetical protein FPHYL_8261 [Fusarium phyllophilum]|uniref:Uncharacterized protein n=1 Tax=Fusarium phyllophilum TaxID=47803 RepID=A0A8H5N7F1_9HYPO|nr:hypothetical protein FPHYL_8261 [Fusarium phyllophilum]
MKNKAYMRCHKYSRSWLDEICAANEDLSEYRYATIIEEPFSIETNAIASLEAVTTDKRFKEITEGAEEVIATIDLTGASPLTATVPREQASKQSAHFLYQKECRLAWIKYLGLLGRVKLREGLDGLPFFHGMPPELLTHEIDTERLDMIQKEAMRDPRNSLITISKVLNVLRDRPQQSHIAWGVIQQKLAIHTFIEDRDKIKYWESASSRNPLALLQSTQTPSGETSVHKVIQYAMNRLVGIQTQEDDPPSCPGYVLPMASFERAIMNAQRTKNETQRGQWADMSLRSLRNFIDAQNNEAVIDKMIEFQKHYEDLAALSSK